MFIKSLFKFFGGLLLIILDVLVRMAYLCLPLWFFMLILQLRKNVDKVTGLTIYYSEDSTWHTIYDGVVLVNTQPGALERRLLNIKNWFIKTKYMWIVVAILIIISTLIYIAIKLH